MKRLLSVLLCLALLCCGVSAVGGEGSIDEEVRALLDRFGLDAQTFAVSYYNLSDGESYSFNETAFFPAGEVWQLPLHMYYYKQEVLGAFDPPDYSPNEIYTVGGMTLSQCRYQSILQGNTDVAEAMRDALGDFRQYQLLMNESFGHCETQTLPTSFYTDACYSADFLMNCLKALSSTPEYFGDLMPNYRLAQSELGMAAADSPYSLVHVRGEAGGMICDVGEVSAPKPYLLVCFVSSQTGGDAVLGELVSLFNARAEQTQAPTQPPTASLRNESDFQVSTVPAINTVLLRWIGLSLAGVVVLAAVVLLIVLLLRRKKHKP